MPLSHASSLSDSSPRVYSANLKPHTLTWRYIELTPNERDLVIYLRRRAVETPDAPIPHLDIIRHIWGARAARGRAYRKLFVKPGKHTRRAGRRGALTITTQRRGTDEDTA